MYLLPARPQEMVAAPDIRSKLCGNGSVRRQSIKCEGLLYIQSAELPATANWPRAVKTNSFTALSIQLT